SYGGLVRDLASDDECNYINLIRNFDTGVSGIKSELVNINIFPKNLKDEVIETLTEGQSVSFVTYNNEEYRFEYNDDRELIASRIIAVHELPDGTKISFKLDDESDGTRRILDLLPALSNRSSSDADYPTNYTYIIDEFDRSLHPILSRAFLNAFLNDGVGNPQDQMIVTTHESSLLDNKLLRRDEIWFVQKEDDHSSVLYSLNDYSPRFDKDIRSAYLSGVYGAVPHIPSFKGDK
ncbi:AAA family ATPase, partial [Vibrio cholerae]